MPDPAVPAYLSRTYASKPDQKGGTLIAEGVVDLDDHLERLGDPDAYRPERCPYCGRRPHVLDRRSRKLRDQTGLAEVDISRYRCRPCRAVWQVVPALLCRYLHRTWGAVQSMLMAAGDLLVSGAEWPVRRKPATVARWRGRLSSTGRTLVHALRGGELAAESVLDAVGLDASRYQLLEALASAGVVVPERKLAQLAGWIHRLVPGLRLM